jgi:hypothetical protein
LVESFADLHKFLKKCENMDLKVHERFSLIKKHACGALSVSSKSMMKERSKPSNPHGIFLKSWTLPQEPQAGTQEGSRRRPCHRR